MQCTRSSFKAAMSVSFKKQRGRGYLLASHVGALLGHPLDTSSCPAHYSSIPPGPGLWNVLSDSFLQLNLNVIIQSLQSGINDTEYVTVDDKFKMLSLFYMVASKLVTRLSMHYGTTQAKGTRPIRHTLLQTLEGD